MDGLKGALAVLSRSISLRLLILTGRSFVAFGGHAGAAGMTLEVDQLPALSQALTDYIREQEIDLSSKSSLAIDEELHLTELTLETLKSFERLSPFGMDNKSLSFGP